MKRFLITLCLIVLLAASMVTVTALYISGPNIKYDKKIEQQMDAIKQQNKETILSIDRHAFRYVTYIAKTEHEYIWYDSEAKELLRRKEDNLNLDEAKEEVMNHHALTNPTVSLGYGFKQGVYVVEDQDYVVMLDIDTRKEVYYQRK